MWTILLIISLVMLIYYYTIKPLYYWKNRGVKQGPMLRAYLDNFFAIFRRQSAAHLIQNMYHSFTDSRYFGFYQFNVPTLMVTDTELIKLIMIKDFDYFTDHRSFVPADIDPLWGKNLFALTGAEWRQMRPTLSPSFTSSKMKGMFFLMKDCAETFVRHFLDKNEDVVTVEIKDVMTRYCNDVIATTSFGIEVNSLDQPDNEFYRMGKKATNFQSFSKQMRFIGYVISPTIYRLLGLRLFEDDVETFFKSLVDDTIKIREEKGIVRHDMIHLLMEARKGIQENEEKGMADTGFATVEEANLGKISRELTNEDITAQALVFFFAGFDSVSSMMCFLAYELVANPEIQDKLREEISKTLEMCKGKLTYEALVNMKYMDMVFSEVLRKWPINIATDRVCTKPYTIEPVLPDEQPVHLEKGTYILFPQYGIQHDPELYPEPERFDPERFNDENKANIKPCSYLPFGLGPRNCIGSRFALLEVKILFFNVLANFDIVPVEKSTIPIVLAKSMFYLGSEGGFWFGLKRRQK
ncbi:unnamed protein product [Phaedon cochleariae]|uniref:Cytochrome P450 n=1 Tax=Phaedon cochleariae TaxID=80249 RepID=A0A9N9X526_PHACE|nr:unnamed protein product [Phaedon cochleariae]